MRDYRHYFSAMFWHNYCIMFFMMRCGYIEVTVNLGEADKKCWLKAKRKGLRGHQRKPRDSLTRYGRQLYREKTWTRKYHRSILQCGVFSKGYCFSLSIQNLEYITRRGMCIDKGRFWFDESHKGWWHIGSEILQARFITIHWIKNRDKAYRQRWHRAISGALSSWTVNLRRPRLWATKSRSMKGEQEINSVANVRSTSQYVFLSWNFQKIPLDKLTSLIKHCARLINSPDNERAEWSFPPLIHSYLL